MNQLQVPQGNFHLNRYPVRKGEQLCAWDAADEYLLQALAEQQLTLRHPLILNDAFGTLAVGLSDFTPCVVTDSFVSEQGIIANLMLNHIDPGRVRLQNSLQPLEGVYDLVVIKVPKSLAMLEDQLYRLRSHCDESTRIIAAGMSKHIHSSTLKLFERILGTTTTSLARKKARLIFTHYDASLRPGESPYPSEYTLETTGETYLNHANVFSRDRLDLGARFMLEHLPSNECYLDIVDLACGNGVLGIAAARLNPQAQVCFVDESYMAVESARVNVERLLGEEARFSFRVTDCLQGIENDSVDLVINNPPFHQHHAVGDFVAWQMFSEARGKLRAGGELWVVANRHLAYHVKLKRLFGNCDNIAGNRKFVILRATRTA